MEQARLDPQSIWAGKESLIIDEAQKCPQLFHAIKQAVDGVMKIIKKLVLN